MCTLYKICNVCTDLDIILICLAILLYISRLFTGYKHRKLYTYYASLCIIEIELYDGHLLDIYLYNVVK